MIDRRVVKYFDWGLLGLTFLLAVLGLLTLYSAVTSSTAAPQKILYLKQLIWYCIGLGVIVFSLFFNYKLLDRWAPVIYVICVCLLIYVLIFGKYVAGARRWFDSTVGTS